MYCTNCGYKLNDGDVFCTNCGKKIKIINYHANEEKSKENLLSAIEAMKNGDSNGFNIIYRATCNYVYSRSKYILGNEQDAYDLMQEVYLTLYKNIGGIRNNESLTSWLKTVVFRCGMHFINKKKGEILVTENYEEIFETLMDENVKIEEECVQQEDISFIRTCVERLSEEQRIVILAYYYDGMKVDEIAEALEISEGTVKSRLYLARNRLKKLITEQEEKQGYKFYSAGIPTLVLALRAMMDSSTVLSNIKMNEMYHHIQNAANTGVLMSGISENVGMILHDNNVVTDSVILNAEEKIVKEVVKNSAWSGISRLGMKKIVLGTIGITSAVVIGGTVIPSVIKNKNEAVSMEQEIDEIVPAVTPEIINIPLENEDANDDEYIFPNSDTELLTDQDLENLSVEVLALARNEIIARHGRIFTKEIYKNYFESKSWYKGFIEPNVFDSSYDEILNEIEKVNINLIKKHETKLNNIVSKDIIDKYYDDVLLYYQEEERQGFPRPDLELISPAFLNHVIDIENIELYYTVIDIANDGIPELFVRNGEIIHGAFGCAHDGQIWPLISSRYGYLGGGTYCYICENGILKVIENAGNRSEYISYYRLSENSCDPEFIGGVHGIVDCSTTYVNDDGSYAIGEFITDEEYIRILENYSELYPEMTNITWYKLSEYEVG